jgi:hypothetical protein
MISKILIFNLLAKGAPVKRTTIVVTRITRVEARLA